ncbi:S26 family signal peptidase [Methanimicrococcus blatticola]|uniref:Signal peptidase n=1 Tax=Methanimicrococcus blatticola TaxID=91560 RepID=A0A484F354_9EURY|nr:S26 family signal peptidase [Methanimicrococcus blatticola]MBZ3936360.1 S26 family signal peptidase [Methanimicrococcus blatticola]MCC2509522.1 S26 family signal peptidase [Methanimicrococcus blatticola]TDQ67575.1 signal peptidase [Methanimicrococcus blatticola]
MLENEQLKGLLKDIGTVVGIVLAFLLVCYIAFGLWTPMYVVSSTSMEPNMNVGDIVFVRSIDRGEVITQQDALSMSSKVYMKFGNPGDVILFRPYGNESYMLVIHRAMYYVEAGEEMWPGGPIAPHAGYITQGDNEQTNPILDQQTTISYQTPVKEEWIVGTSRFKIPFIGKIRLLFFPNRLPF